MSHRQLFVILGIWTIIFLFLGFPSSWNRWIAVATGILVIAVAFKLKRAEEYTLEDALSESGDDDLEVDAGTHSVIGSDIIKNSISDIQ